MLFIKQLRNLSVLFLLCQSGVVALAAPAGNLFSAEVSVEDRTAEAKKIAAANALALVMVKVSGDRRIARSSAAAGLLQNAHEYVQQYRYTPNGTLLLAFDARQLQTDMRTAGLPVWGSDRPATLVWMVVDDGEGERQLIAADSQGEARTLIESAASARGVPLVWPLYDSQDQAVVTEADVWGGFQDPIQMASSRYGADAIMVVKLSRGNSDALLGNWTLQSNGQPLQWRGGISQGVNRMADHYATQLASVTQVGAALQTVVLRLTDLTSARAYAGALSTIEKLGVVEQVSVTNVSGTEAQLLVKLQGDAGSLRRALSFSPRLEANSSSVTDTLSYRFKR